MSDNDFLALGFEHMPGISQLFVKINRDGLVLLLIIDIADDILVCGPDGEHRGIIKAFGDNFELVLSYMVPVF